MDWRTTRTENHMADHQALDTRGDAELLRESRRSSAAFRILYDRHAARIHRFHLRRSRDPGAAVELTAETFAQAWLSRDRYLDHDEGTIAPWLFGIARHVLAASVRRHALDRNALERLRLDVKPTVVEVNPSWLEGLDDDLGTALAELPDGQRRAIELRVLADRAYEDVARELDCTPQAARVRVHRGISAIRRRLTGHTDHIDLPATEQPQGAPQ
jgi:RNA polymerase sigma factor (sigma-70 family)